MPHPILRISYTWYENSVSLSCAGRYVIWVVEDMVTFPGWIAAAQDANLPWYHLLGWPTNIPAGFHEHPNDFPLEILETSLTSIKGKNRWWFLETVKDLTDSLLMLGTVRTSNWTLMHWLTFLLSYQLPVWEESQILEMELSFYASDTSMSQEDASWQNSTLQ